MFTPGQVVLGRYMLLNLTSFVEWQVVTNMKQKQIDIDNLRGKSRRVTHDYAISDQVYAEMTGIYQKLDYRKQGLYRITEVFTKCTVWVQQGRVKTTNKHKTMKLSLLGIGV